MDAFCIEAACIELTYNIYSEETLVWGCSYIGENTIQLSRVSCFLYSCGIGVKAEIGEDIDFTIFKLCFGCSKVLVEATHIRERKGEGVKTRTNCGGANGG